MDETLVLDTLEFGAQIAIPPENFRVEFDRNAMLRRTFVSAFLTMLGRTVEDQHEEWPATWWDAFKERWFPMWLKRRVGVDFYVYRFSVAEVAPRLKIPEEYGPMTIVVTDEKRLRVGYKGEDYDLG